MNGPVEPTREREGLDPGAPGRRSLIVGCGYVGEAVARRIAARQKHEPLTSREREVLVLLAEGLTYEAIGERLGIAKRTARAHVVALQEKFDAANNAQVVARGYARGLLRPEGS